MGRAGRIGVFADVTAPVRAILPLSHPATGGRNIHLIDTMPSYIRLASGSMLAFSVIDSRS
jgi:hypothetical protein